MPKKTLTNKQQRFLEEYPKDWNATQAAIRAGYKAKNADVTGSKLVKRLLPQARMQARTPVLADLTMTSQTVIDLDRFNKRVERLAFYDVRQMFDNHGNPLDIPDLPDDVAPAVAGFEFEENFLGGKGQEKMAAGYTKKVKLVNPIEACHLYAKVHGLYKVKDDLEGSPLEDAATDLLLAMRAAILNQAANRKAVANGGDT